MRLDIGVLGAEELFGAFAGEVFDDVHVLAAAVITFAGVTFGVLVGEDAAGGLEDGFGGEVFAGDELEAAVLALQLAADGAPDVGIRFGQRPGHEALVIGHCVSLSRLRGLVADGLERSWREFSPEGQF